MYGYKNMFCMGTPEIDPLAKGSVIPSMESFIPSMELR